MKILAIIPAAEGLNMLPNRNLRVICGRPLIYYAINNAKQSKYINDIIVTSNSDEVLVIAEQMGGVTCYKRPDKLCGIDVPLEQVINDVRNIVNFEDYDYVITMQSISPVLKFSTLDCAIEKCITENIDTLISVKKQQRFIWYENGNNIQPLYQNRVSKNQLTPSYVETGAFFISRPEYIDDSNRIGGKIRLFPLDVHESIDVRSFGELKEAEFFLSVKRVAFYVNGNNLIGMGHIHRTLMLADEFFTKPIIFYNKKITDKSFFGDTSYDLIGIENYDELIDELKTVKCGVLINDVLDSDDDYMRRLRVAIPGIKIVNFEDEGPGTEYADAVINALYDKKINDKWKTGPGYYIAPKLYLMQNPIEVHDKVKNVLITFGGADPCDYTQQVLDLIMDEHYSKFIFHVIIGPAYANTSIVSNYQKGNIKYYKGLDSIINVMNKCDVAISARGRTGFELAICGIPTLCVAENERETRHDFMSNKNGFTYIGYKPEKQEIKKGLDNLLMMSKDQRIKIQKLMQNHDLKNGRKHVIDLINSL